MAYFSSPGLIKSIVATVSLMNTFGLSFGLGSGFGGFGDFSVSTNAHKLSALAAAPWSLNETFPTKRGFINRYGPPEYLNSTLVNTHSLQFIPSSTSGPLLKRIRVNSEETPDGTFGTNPLNSINESSGDDACTSVVISIPGSARIDDTEITVNSDNDKHFEITIGSSFFNGVMGSCPEEPEVTPDIPSYAISSFSSQMRSVMPADMAGVIRRDR